MWEKVIFQFGEGQSGTGLGGRMVFNLMERALMVYLGRVNMNWQVLGSFGRIVVGNGWDISV